MVLVGYIVRLKGNFDLGGFIVDGGSMAEQPETILCELWVE